MTSCSVSLLTNSMGVEGTASSGGHHQAVQDAGYGASLKGAAATLPSTSAEGRPGRPRDAQAQAAAHRLAGLSAGADVLLHGAHDVGLAAAPLFDGNHVAMGLVQLLLAGIVMVINQKFFISGFKGLLHGAPNMDTLVALGSMASFV